MTVEPGRVMAGRYRVEDLLSDRAGARSWRAVDEVLRRSVAIDVLPADSPQASDLAHAARRAAGVADARFLRVLDVSEEEGDVYVVREWTRGESLDLVLANGPLNHRRAAWLVSEVAAAVAKAHQHGIHHLQLAPRNVVVTDTGAVKVVGLATEAALHGVRHADAEAEDVRGLARLLYACLVARWPGAECDGLPAAPTEHGRVLSPRQVRAGVPRPLDQVCDQVLGEPPRHPGTPLRHASDVVSALTAAVGLTAAPMAGAASQPTRTADLEAPAARTTPVTTRARPQGTPRVPVDPDDAGPTRKRRTRPWLVALAALLVVAAALTAFLIGRGTVVGDDDPRALADNRDGSASGPATQAPRLVRVSGVQAFDPFGDEGENNAQATLAIDDDPSTAWPTVGYGSAQLGNLKPGLGLILDLGRPSDVAQVAVTLANGAGGTDLELRTAPADASGPPNRPGAFETVATVDGAGGDTTLEPEAPVTARYLLLWLTRLPALGDEPYPYRAEISEIAVRG